MKRIVDLLELLSPEPQVATRNHRRAMVENLRELDECHLATFASRVNNLATKGLAETMRAKVFDIKVISRLDGLELAVDALSGNDVAAAVEEAKLIGVLDIQGVVAVADMPLERRINLNIAALARLLLDKRKVSAAK